MGKISHILSPFHEDQPGTEPYAYNVSHWGQRVPIAILAMVGFLISSYLALYQWKLIGSAWDPFFGDQTQKVLDSDVSHRMWSFLRIPDASLGALAYLGDAIYGLVGSTRRWQYRPWMVVLFGIDVIPLGIVSSVLVFMQGAVVGSWCTLCLVTAVISLILVRMAFDEVRVCLLFLWRVYKRGGGQVLWKTFWGTPTDIGWEVGEAMLVHEQKPQDKLEPSLAR